MLVPITIMLCFARSGGTVLNQCLGSLPNVVILSELNPLGSGSGSGDEPCDTVRRQAKEWYGINLVSKDFVRGILDLAKICEQQGKQLIIRDWSFVNFYPIEDNDLAPPNKFLIVEALQGHCELNVFGFVRDAIDVCLSYAKGIFAYHRVFTYYRNYVDALVASRYPYFKYEDFCRHPRDVMQAICKHINTDYSESFLEYATFGNVSGEVQSEIKSRGVKQDKIAPLPRKVVDIDKITAINANSNMKRTNEVLGYDQTYEAEEPM